jgi:hypothetical protein
MYNSSYSRLDGPADSPTTGSAGRQNIRFQGAGSLGRSRELASPARSSPRGPSSQLDFDVVYTGSPGGASSSGGSRYAQSLERKSLSTAGRSTHREPEDSSDTEAAQDAARQVGRARRIH